jgi:hypothetical protein
VGRLEAGVCRRSERSQADRSASHIDVRSASVLRARWAVRRDWPDGLHEYIQLCDTETEVLMQLECDCNYWRRGPLRPRLSVVRISVHDFELHGRYRRECTAPDCPQASTPEVAV